MKKLSARALSAQLLLQVLDEGKSLSSLLAEKTYPIATRDMPLMQEICFGVCRVLPRLEAIIRLLVEKPLKGKTRIVHCLLLVGLYQLLYLRIPAFAAVDEVVNATKALNVDKFRALTNGVLRRFLREQESLLAKVDKNWQTLHPEWLVNCLKSVYPNWREIVKANNQHPPMWVRVNSQFATPEEYANLLGDNAKNSEKMTACRLVDNLPQGAILMTKPLPVNQLPHFEQGWVTVQDVHAQWAAWLLAPQNGEVVLDACAAPGGKTTHILEIAPQAQVTALDIEQHRLQRVEENLKRLGQQARVVCGDASQPECWLDKSVMFDRILLDAPCSATGVIRRHPDIKWLRQESDIQELVKLQRKILDALWQRLKPNGVLLYATCSVLPEENSLQIQQFIADMPDAKPFEMTFAGEKVMEKQFLPTEKGGDGFFYAKLIKMS
ncbi:16S rRNA m(5)C-967 methyltransferase [Nicoletella semolina]|uniref:16S rRNA (cytosine(967)-C(5))-methyltransferase n=1 Tax=Nicoletella semolina TaxID=271160 RepID=A0A4R2N4S5_9PAST|nr:16S rRNA (cytosine(967)-C(5))-methyltransferase RsmB [Nicoletella semolina]MDH2924581.1 16S rRNA (cytosine(967)-C(5))-methyltransferase [Nicoletella semolina]TCP15804.1 16S rRNA m(5)C-967 methyltransferase [Nicoletella semolina]